MPAGLLQGEGSALAAAGAVSLPFGLGRLQISLYAVYRGFAALLCKSAFPNCNDGPGKRVEALGIEFVTGNVAGNLFSPELCIRLWLDILGTPAMTMPKAAVYEDDCPILGQNDVRLTWKAIVIEAVSVPLCHNISLTTRSGVVFLERIYCKNAVGAEHLAVILAYGVRIGSAVEQGFL